MILKYRDTTLQFAPPRAEVAAAMQGTYAILKSVCTDDQHKQRAHFPPSFFMRPGVKQTTFFRYDIDANSRPSWDLYIMFENHASAINVQRQKSLIFIIEQMAVRTFWGI
jgi:hypothetical protein